MPAWGVLMPRDLSCCLEAQDSPTAGQAAPGKSLLGVNTACHGHDGTGAVHPPWQQACKCQITSFAVSLPF